MVKTKRTKGKVKLEIVRIALAIFADKGFDATSIDEIISKAGIAKGTFYYYFDSKEKLIQEIIHEGINKFALMINSGMAGLPDEEARIRKLIEIEIDFFNTYKNFCVVFVGEFWRYQTRWHEDIKLIQSRYMDVIKSYVRSSSDNQIIGPMLFWVGATMSLDWQMFRPKMSKQELVDRITKIMLHGIKSKL